MIKLADLHSKQTGQLPIMKIMAGLPPALCSGARSSSYH
jgi:hypothetical protein